MRLACPIRVMLPRRLATHASLQYQRHAPQSARPALQNALVRWSSTQPDVPQRRTISERVLQNLWADRLNHAAGFFRALALVQSDVLHLQSLMLVSSNITFYRLWQKQDFTQAGYVCVFAALSAFATFRLVCERFVWLDEDEERIRATHFGTLTQPQFKKLLSCAVVHAVDEDDASSSPALSDYFGAKYPARGRRVLSIGSEPTLHLLLEGKARIVRNLAKDDDDYRRNKAGQIKQPLKPSSIKPVLIERGPGFCGEASFIQRQACSDADAARKVRARADVTFDVGSRYAVWDTRKLEALLKADAALRNALLACLTQATAKKLYEVTWSVGKANEHAHQLKHMLYDEYYKQEVLDVIRHALVETVATGGEQAAREPSGVEILRPRLARLQTERGVDDETHGRALQEIGLDLPRGLADGASLLMLCDTDVGLASQRHTDRHQELKSMLKREKARNRVVRFTGYST